MAAPGKPTLVRPVLIGDCPVMKAARPAVQLCSPYQSVNSAPSLAMRSMFGRAVTHHAQIVGAHIEPADIVGHDHEDIRLAAAGEPGAGVGAGAAFCACANASEVIAAAATRADEPSKIFRRVGARSSVAHNAALCRSCSLVSSGMFGSFFTGKSSLRSRTRGGWLRFRPARPAAPPAVVAAIARRAQVRAAFQNSPRDPSD